MKNMSWNDLKKYIDKKLADENISSDTDIWYIDISFPMMQEGGEAISDMYEITTHVDENSGIAIS